MKLLQTFTAAVAITLLSLTAAAETSPGPTSHFAWGAEAGGSIDMTSNDMSTLNLNAMFGYRNSLFQMLGVGAGIQVMVDNSCRAFPIFAVMRTSFRTAPSLCFFDLRAGCAVNNVNDDSSQTRLYVSPSVGFNLARNRNFVSYVTVGYEYNGLKDYVKDGEAYHIGGGLSMAVVKIGITF